MKWQYNIMFYFFIIQYFRIQCRCKWSWISTAATMWNSYGNSSTISNAHATDTAATKLSSAFITKHVECFLRSHANASRSDGWVTFNFFSYLFITLILFRCEINESLTIYCDNERYILAIKMQSYQFDLFLGFWEWLKSFLWFPEIFGI